jgi:uncharacterized Zn finger protein
MEIIISNKFNLTNEQIKNKSRTIKVPDDIALTVKNILEKDEFNFFNTKSLHSIKRQLKSTQSTIAKLIKLKVKSVEAQKSLTKKYNQLVSNNNELKNKLKMKVS